MEISGYQGMGVGRRMNRESTRDFWGSESTLQDTVMVNMVDPCH